MIIHTHTSINCSNLFFLVDGSAILDVYFSQFTQKPPAGFQEIMLEKSIF